LDGEADSENINYKPLNKLGRQ